ncbi:hypothetical protein OC846_003623 [Tilletia horrida]|uniref:Hyaluronan/mRNA-binding protein domain-containing protein n=1 Tax=Tilletia horrida TaxID=155126 RepID=A0AAN6JRK1_9BASI|nr:hypothetical protein OC845_005378 [Tilletia horrida]KAK0550519.1 hypothetical protein OC846_003623 [Tilletia horrida]KAK0565650.1 hypothetical protein OC861_003667 [Tilletia horrida]
MSVASQNPFALLDDDAKPAAAPAVKAPVAANPTSAAPRAGVSVAQPNNTRSSVPGSGGRSNNRGTGSYPRGGARGGNRGGAAPAAAGAGEEEGLPSRQREPRGDRGDRGGRGRGRGRGGRGRPFDRHSQTGKEDTEKRVAQGWGGDDPKRELDAEDKAVADADAEKNGEAPVANGDAAPAAEGEAAAPAAGATPTIPEEEVDNTKTLDQYLAEQTAKKAQLGGGPKEIRATGDDQWTGFGTQLVKDTEGEAFYYKAKEDKASNAAKSSGKKEKQFLEIDATFAAPAGAREGGRGGRGRGEGRGGYRGRGEGGRGGGARGGRGRGDGARRGGASNAGVNLSDQSAFPSLS